jgi:hypothetical protein
MSAAKFAAAVGRTGLTALELNRIAPPKECEKLSSASWDTLKRAHPDKVVQISPRREGMRVGDALMFGSEK